MLICLFVVARFDFSWGDSEYHQETLENLKAAIKATKKLCAVCITICFCLFLTAADVINAFLFASKVLTCLGFV